jgi:hypothetical protein
MPLNQDKQKIAGAGKIAKKTEDKMDERKDLEVFPGRLIFNHVK